MGSDKKHLSKPRHERNRKTRAVRRGLTNTESINLQRQSLFFSVLPSEIRYIIFKYILCQTHDFSRPIKYHSFIPLYRPGHEYETTHEISMLFTCRLAYYEAHAIRMRSITHHPKKFGVPRDMYLEYLTSRQGANLYHLHEELTWLRPTFPCYWFRPHYKWRKVTWTIPAFAWQRIFTFYRKEKPLIRALKSTDLPSSCEEVSLELEYRDDAVAPSESLLPWLAEQIQACRQISLKRTDGTFLKFHPHSSKEFIWTGNAPFRLPELRKAETDRAVNRVFRLSWRSQVPRREYAGYDYLDCLRSDLLVEVPPTC